MDVRSNQAYYSFVYDPTLYGFNTAYWKELNGSAATTSNKIRLNSVTIVSKHQYLRGKFIWSLSMPTPTEGQNKEWGFKSPAIGTLRNAAYFQVSGGNLFCITVGATGTVTTTQVDSSYIATDGNSPAMTWTNPNQFQIFWKRNQVEFSINGYVVATMTDRNFVPQNTTVPTYVANNNPDNMDVSYVEMDYVDQVVVPQWELPIVSPAGTTDVNIEAAGENIAITESVTANVSPPVSVSDSITVSESVTGEVRKNVTKSEAVTITENVTAVIS
jgi:hypothetical protein